MSFSRYSPTPVLAFGTQYGTSVGISKIRAGIKNGTIKVDEVVLQGAERLDTLAGLIYGNSDYWWILAAASDIGWGLQVPVGTVIKIPKIDVVIAVLSQ